MRKTVSGMMLTLVLIGMLTLVFNIQPVKASGTIYIQADGSIYPLTAPISSGDNITYTFTDNVYDSIVVERSNIIIDGNGYMLQGLGSGNGLYWSGIDNVTIKNTNIKEFSYGVYTSYSSYNNISGNNITNNYDGVYLGSSSHNSISGNNIAANGWSGVWLDGSSNNFLRDNVMAGNSYNFMVHGGALLDFVNDVDTSNTVDGKPVYYWVSMQDAYVPLEAGYVALVNCTNINVENLTLTKNGQGILLAYTANTTITGNNITNNYDGVHFIFSSNSNVYGNNITANNWSGIALHYSSNNRISGNNITNNGCGLRLIFSSNNNIYHNSFVHNTVEAYLYISVNVWDDGYPSGGNYWRYYTGVDEKNGPNQDLLGSDGISDTPYVIDANNQDRYPLMHPWSPLPVHNLNTGLGYATIQEAINAPETLDGHTIFVEPGTYYENVIVNKTLSLIGKNKNTTTIDGRRTGNGVTVTANNTVIDGFTVRRSGIPTVEYTPTVDTGILIFDVFGRVVENTTIINNDLRDNYVGIFIWNSIGNTIVNNNLENNSVGIGVGEAIHNKVCRNKLSNNIGGIWLSSGYNNVSSNILSLNLAYGLEIDDSSFNSVTGNIIEYNGYGIELMGWSNNVTGNTMRNNDCPISMGESENNFIYHNNFMDNTNPVEGGMGYPNTWDDGYPSGGNYWSDYNGSDHLYGIGDIPYIIDENNIDHYPLMAPISMFNAGTWNGTLYSIDIISNSTISNFQLNITEKIIRFNVTGETGLGFCRVTIPNVIVQEMWHGNYTVLMNGESWPFTNWTDAENTYIYFTYQHSEHEVTIIIPEFPQAIILPLFMILSAPIIVFARRKPSRKRET